MNPALAMDVSQTNIGRHSNEQNPVCRQTKSFYIPADVGAWADIVRGNYPAAVGEFLASEFPRERIREHMLDHWRNVMVVSTLRPIANEPAWWINPEAHIEETRQGLLQALDDIRRSTSTENWDHEDAPPLDPEVFEHAKTFILNLPLSKIDAPDITPNPQGEIEFSWDCGSVEDMFDVAVQSSGQIAIAGIFENVRVHGDVAWDKKSFARVVDLVRWTNQ